MTCTTGTNGRLGNQIIRNLAVSFIAEKHNLKVNYYNKELISQLGVPLFNGTNNYKQTVFLTDENYFNIYDVCDFNLNPNESYFQTKEITTLIYNYLQSDKIKNEIIKKNPFKDRYKNNDLFIHVRLTDASRFNPGIQYYLKAISKIEFDNLFLSSDHRNHIIVKKIIELYPETKIINYNEINTIQFASTCKHIVLSHGSFSAIIGYLAFFSNVYYPKYEENKMWYGDMFSIKSWNKIS
jgi:hypothetical protein